MLKNSNHESSSVPPPVPASTVMLLRDSTRGPQVFMLARRQELERFGGALVFPGGKVEARDSAPRLRDYCAHVEKLHGNQFSLRVAAVREAFEETGLLFARDRDSAGFLDPVRMASLSAYREKLEAGTTSLADFLRSENLVLAVDLLVPFSNWVTPPVEFKRFDTYFFVAAVPAGVELLHCGRETEDSLWATPQELLDGEAAGRWEILFPTLCNLSKLATGRSVSEVITSAVSSAGKPIMPKMERHEDGLHLSIPQDAGYPKWQHVIPGLKK